MHVYYVKETPQLANLVLYLPILLSHTHTHTHTLIVLGFHNTSTLVGHFLLSPENGRKEIVEEMKKRDKEERETGMKVKKQKK